ncbi:mitochondrial carrier domain-containing protein [Lipomyces arxii]|uniref:mitochondrial carrier domain-containing protein n=1 Tax=Lipomyces arxii TaxID=56418 RepID=UPI0034D01330
MATTERRQDVWIDAVAGFSAGCATTLVVHPLDLVKVRLQLDNTKVTHMGGVLAIILDIRQSVSPLREAYRGLIPNLIGNTVSWGSYFFLYEQIKARLNQFYGHDRLSSSDYFLSAGTAGCLTAVLTNPIWVVKTRMLSTNSGYSGAYKGTLNGLQRIYIEEGLRGFYRGFLPGLLGIGHGAVQLMFYEKLKSWYLNTVELDSKGTQVSRDMSTLQYIMFSATSKIGASVVMYPTQVLKSRLQIYNADSVYSSVRDVIKKTFNEEGLSGFYKGLLPNLFRVVPATCVTFVVYENTRKYLK